MKYLLAITCLGISLAGFNWGMLATVAQSDCVQEVNEWEEDAVTPLLQGYDEVGEDVNDIESVAALQAIRREFNDVDTPSEAAEVKAMFISMIDLRTDAVVALYLGDQDLSRDLLDDSQSTRENALALIDHLCPDLPQAEIMSPEGDIEGNSTIIEGTYELATLGNSHLWVVILAQTGKYFPQVIMDGDCNENTAVSVTYGPAPGTWQINAIFGGDPPQQYDVILYVAEPDEHEAMLDLLGDWCSDGSFPGLTDVSSPPYGFEYLDDVHITRPELE